MSIKMLPNLITSARIALSGFVFALLAAAAGLWPGAPLMAAEMKPRLVLWALIAFVVAALTDFLDGWLARRLDAQSRIGAILDPIADKIAVVSAVLGLGVLDPPLALWPGALILMRELFVAGLRETGMKLPVTQLAKWKTTVQLAAFAVAMASISSPELHRPAAALLWLATGLTLWTGWDYLQKTLRALKA